MKNVLFRRSSAVLLAMTALVIGSLGLALGAGAKPEDEYSKLLEKANRLLRKGKYQRAFDMYGQANRAYGGGSAFALVGQSVALNSTGEHDRAYEHARKAVELAQQPTLAAEAQSELAYAIALGSLDDREALEKAIVQVRDYLAGEGPERLAVHKRLCAARRALGWAYGSEEQAVAFDGTDSSLTKPEKVWVPQPWPTDAERRQLASREAAEVEATIDVDGCVVFVAPVKATSRTWGEVVARTLATWIFQPARRDGRPIAVHYRLTTSFSMG